MIAIKKQFALFLLLGLSLSCASKPTRESFCRSLSTDQSLVTVNVFEETEAALKKQKAYCEPDFSISDEAFRESYVRLRNKQLMKDCACEKVVVKQYEKGFGVDGGSQTKEDWAAVCASAGQQVPFEKGLRAGDALKAKMKTEFEFIQRIGYSQDQIKERCGYGD